METKLAVGSKFFDIENDVTLVLVSIDETTVTVKVYERDEDIAIKIDRHKFECEVQDEMLKLVVD